MVTNFYLSLASYTESKYFRVAIPGPFQVGLSSLHLPFTYDVSKTQTASPTLYARQTVFES